MLKMWKRDFSDDGVLLDLWPGNFQRGASTPVSITCCAGSACTDCSNNMGYGGVEYAGFWLRFVAYIIDGIVSCIAFVILLIPLFVLTGAGAALGRIISGEDVGDDVSAFLGAGFILGFFGIILVVSWLYYALSESSSWQATLGKKILNLKVTDMTGQRITFGRASGRYFAKIITGMIPLLIGYIMAGFTEKKQAIHDMIASCLVLRKV